MSFEAPGFDALSPAKKALYERLLNSRKLEKQNTVAGKTTGDLVLTPNQRDEFEIVNPDRHIFNMPLLLKTSQCLPQQILEGAVSAVLNHHDGLRLVSKQHGDEWLQQIAEMPNSLPVQFHDLSGIEDIDKQTQALEHIVNNIQRSFVLDTGPLLQVAQFDCGKLRGARILIVAHHMACDQYSANIVLQDMALALFQLQQGSEVKLPNKTTSLIDWAQRLADFAHDDRIKSQISFWENVCSTPLTTLPSDTGVKENIGAYVSACTMELDQATLNGLKHDRLRKLGLDLQTIYITACAEALSDWKANENVCLAMLHHGRTHPFGDIDLSRTVGWFSYQYPLVLNINSQQGGIEQTFRIHEQIQAVPNHGVAYGLLRHFGTQDEKIRLPAPPMDMFLNMQFGCKPMKHELFEIAAESTGKSDSPTINRPIPLYLNIHSREDVVFMHCTFNERIHHAKTINSLLAKIGKGIESISRSIELQRTGAANNAEI